MAKNITKRRETAPKEGKTPERGTEPESSSDDILARALAAVAPPPPFDSCFAYGTFAMIVQRHARYFRTIDTAFLQTLLASARARTKRIAKGATLCRAQLGAGPTDLDLGNGKRLRLDETGPHPPDRMKPSADHARPGRANPRGIPYLYLASSLDVARAEVRPWLGSKVSVSTFEVQRELKVVDCTMDSDQSGSPWHQDCAKCTPEKRESGVWKDLNAGFSRPVGPQDDELAYLPTQVIAEFFKHEGFDGLIYKSAYGPGENVVLFDLSAAELTAGFLYQTKSIEFKYAEIANPYFREIDPETGKSSFVTNKIVGFRKLPKRRRGAKPEVG